MKRLLLSTAIAVFALSSATAFADSGHGQQHHGKHQKHGKRHDDRRDARHDYRHDNGRHLGWEKQTYRRGGYVPIGYIQDQYYVQDYRQYRLAPPPRGYRWVRPSDNHYLLVQATTGLISQILGY